MIHRLSPLDLIYEFPESTSVHGILYIFKKHISKWTRFIWVIIFTLSLAICLYECSLNVHDYLKMNIKTSITYQPTSDIEFPGITFCSTHPYKRSEMGNWTYAPYTLAQYLARNDKELKQLIWPVRVNVNQLTCKSEAQSLFTQMFEKYTAYYFLNGSTTSEAFYKLFAPIVTNFQTDVEKCWVNDEQLDCDNLLINRPTDDTFCFSFNFGSEVVKISLDTSLGNVGSTQINNTNYFSQLKARKKTARFLLKANQSDYCGTGTIKRGAGYYAMLTDRDATSISMFNPPIHLSPGYINNVIIKPIKYIRKTEHMGLCRNRTNVFLVPTTQKYMQSLCYFQCIIRAILQECKCYPPNMIVYHKLLLKNLENFNISKAYVRFCNVETTMCARNFQTRDCIDGNINKKCPECTMQCVENKYDYLLTYLPISVRLLKKQIPKYIVEKLDDGQLKRNYIDVLFSFESNYVEVIEESQAVTIIDLFINLGNNIGLFLGMSFMSAFEITNELIVPLVFMGIAWLQKRTAILKQMFSGVKRSDDVQTKFRKRRKSRPRNPTYE